MKDSVEELEDRCRFSNNWFEEANRDLEEMTARDPIETYIKLIEQKHQQLEEKNSQLEDRSRRNNLRFGGFTKKSEGVEKRGKKVRI